MRCWRSWVRVVLRRGMVSPAVWAVGDLHRTQDGSGTIRLDSVTYKVDTQRAFQQVLVVSEGDTIIITDLLREVLAEHTRPAPGITYVGNGRPRGPRPKTEKPSPKS